MNRRSWLQSALLAAAGGLLGLPVRSRAAVGARIVVVGGGFAGSACALALRRLNAQHEIVLVDPADPYVSCPGSNAVIVGLRPLSQLQESREGLRRAGVLYARDRAAAIDAQARFVQLAGGARLPYERLIVAPGIRFLWERIEGADAATPDRMPHAWTGGEQIGRLASQLRSLRPGGVVAMSVPAGPMRCPPGPYERASLIAHFLKNHKPRSKLLILDARNSFPRQDQFMQAWSRFYPGLIEWIPVTQGGAVERIDPQRLVLYPAAGAIRADVINLIPPQAPAALAPDSGLAAARGWCPVHPLSFESTLVPDIHILGDACIADEMPKAASSALSQASQCALAVEALLAGREPPQPDFSSVCYAHVAPSMALAIPARFELRDGHIAALSGAATPAGTDGAAAADRWNRDARSSAFAN